MSSQIFLGNLLHAAKALGGNVLSGGRIVCPGPGHSPSDRSLSVKFVDGDVIVHSFAGDDWRTCKEYIQSILGGNLKLPPGDTQFRLDEGPSRTERAMEIWREARSILGTPAEIYLATRAVFYNGAALRWHPSCPFGPGTRVGCMIALVTDILSNLPTAIHRTAVGQDGQKLSHLGSNGRMALGPVKGGAIKLYEPEWVSVGVAEGIETALSIRNLPTLEEMPVWALLNAGQLAGFPVLPQIETLWIARDHDPAGIKSVSALSSRYNIAAKEVVILEATEKGKDLNDLITEAN